MKHKRAFTLIELMIIIAIIAILAGMGVANFSAAIRKSRDAKRKSDLSELQQALMMFRADHGSYPCHDNPSDPVCNTNPRYLWPSGVDNLYYNDANGGKFVIHDEYVRTMPFDESRTGGGENDQYAYQCDSPVTTGGSATRCVDFSICAKLEEWKTSGPNAKDNKGNEACTYEADGDACQYFCLYSP